MLADLDAGKARVVTAWHTDRLHRTAKELETYIDPQANLTAAFLDDEQVEQLWNSGWRKRLDELRDRDRPMPAGSMTPLGYVVLGHGVRLNRPVQAYQRWIAKIPVDFHGAVLDETAPPPEPDPYRLAQLKHYHSLMPLA